MSFTKQSRHIHFIGIGGIGMSGLAELVLGLGQKVSGSDLSDSEMLSRLRAKGADIQIGHSTQILSKKNPDVVVYSTAVKAENPELQWAISHQLPVIRRAEMLAELMRLKRGIAVAGSHGKTTTTGLLAILLKAAGVDPTVVIGGRFDAIGSNAIWGEGAWMVAEADESDGSFLRLSPEIAIVTNIDREHLDHYQSFERAILAFEDFIDRLPFYGRAILCSDSDELWKLSQRLRKPRLWYGFDRSRNPDFLVKMLSGGAKPQFELRSKKDSYESVLLKAQLSVPGRHNVLNAAAAAIAAFELDVAPLAISRALEDFVGVRRRFERRGFWGLHEVIEDYAHHPTEITATLAAAKDVFAERAPIVVFQPHRYSRTRDLWKEFSHCFNGASLVITLPIYSASEPPEAWNAEFDGEYFASHIRNPTAVAKKNVAEVKAYLNDLEKIGKIPKDSPLLILGAGDVNKLVTLLVT